MERGWVSSGGGILVRPPDPFGIVPHREALTRWPLHDLVRQLPQVQFQAERLPPGFWPRTVGIGQSDGQVRYACSELVRQAVLWAPVFPYGGLDARPGPSRDLGRLIWNALSLRLAVDDPNPTVLQQQGVETYLFPVVSPQWRFMRSFALRPTQAVWMFRDALAARQRRVAARPGGGGNAFHGARLGDFFTELLGMPVERFVGCIQVLFAHSITNNPVIDSARLHMSPETLRATGFTTRASWARGPQLLTASLARALTTIGASAAQMRAMLADQAGCNVASDEALLVGPGPLESRPVLFPFSNSTAHGIAPVPHLLFEFLYEPLMDLLFQACATQRLSGDFHQLFEEYVGLILQRHSPAGLRWHFEDELRTDDERVVDWVGEFRSQVVLVDAKRGWIRPGARHRLEPRDWTSLHKQLLGGVEQGAAFWRAVRAGRVPALRRARDKAPVLLLVASSDTVLLPYPARFRDELRDAAHRLLPGLKVMVTGLDHFHALTNRWRSRDVEWLPATIARGGSETTPPFETMLGREIEGPMWAGAIELTEAHLAGLNTAS